jgi:hypothetical protein
LAEARRVTSETTKEIATIHPIRACSSARNAVDLEAGVFKHRDPRVIALALTAAGHISTEAVPSAFCLDPAGHFLFAAATASGRSDLSS